MRIGEYVCIYGIGYMCVACIGVVVGLWDFGDFCSCGVFVCRGVCACGVFV